MMNYAVYRPTRMASWSKEADIWGPSVIEFKKFPSIFRLELRAYIREVRISVYNINETAELRLAQTHFFQDACPESLKRYSFLLEAAESAAMKSHGTRDLDNRTPAYQQIAAIGFFDRQYAAGSRPLQMWALRSNSDWGLLLEQTRDQYQSVVYRRLGVFEIVDTAAFYPKETLQQLEYPEKKLPKSNVVLV
jgi:hypothetical protein